MKREFGIKRVLELVAVTAVTAVCCVYVLSDLGKDEKTQTFKTRPADTRSDNTNKAYTPDGGTEISKVFKLPKALEYFSEDLSEEEKRAFSQVYDGICNFDETIEFDDPVIKKEDADDLMSVILAQATDCDQIGESYSISYDKDGTITSITIDYILSKEECDARKTELDAKIDEILSGMNEGWSDYKKVMYLHDTLADICTYDAEGVSPYSAYGCLVDNRAVCQGYSKAMQALCTRAGIDCICVSGTASDASGPQSHIWNKIRIEDTWANFDVTWDDPLTSTGLPYLRYDYFGLSDEQILADHTIDDNCFVSYPAAASTDLNYYMRMGFYYDGTASAEDVMRFSVLSSMSEGDNTARIKCADADCYNQAVGDILNDYTGEGAVIYQILADSIYETGASWSSNEFAYICNDGLYTITIFFR